ncbi:helicase domain protein [Deinococcus aerius]|uniref:Helicase domain protein n=1 Tax=Deinococcus aerius TaxID=200253 RepID=A0A2I9CQX6_9DEIO|nr:DEAD/DEAH box helicase [Deinococcus aerius]GBF03872.1 helicase domain protein [Deinococcus aerius]
MIGDVVGLGKTVMTSALLRMVEKTYFDALILCPPNLVPMWETYVHEYGLRAKVLPLSRAVRELPRERRYRLVVVDESHNLRNRDGKTYLAVKDYVERNDSHVVLLTATPYNKTYLDLSNQLRLFLNEDGDLGIRPEAYLRSLPNGERTFMQLHQCGVRSIQAFEKSGDADDWRDLMRLYLVRRTRSFIQQNYAQHDSETDRSFLAYPDGQRYYFPKRLPKTMSFPVGGQYARLYEERVVSVLEHLCLPRYGLGNYIHEMKTRALTPAQIGVLRDLSRAGVRLMGFVRTNFFKRLESSGFAFVQSIERHIQRNAVLLYALEHDLDLPVGTQDAGLLSARDTDENLIIGQLEQDDPSFEDAEYDVRSAKAAYEAYAGPYSRRFKWLPAHLFKATLRADLLADNHALQAILDEVGAWRPGEDGKLSMLHDLIARVHAGDKVLVFSQFADTIRYLEAQLRARGVTNLGAVTGDTKDPTALARRFAPRGQKVDGELRVLLATDVLSEGQNLQDAHVVVNYDLPWAIIRLVQRAGRVDRIGQQAPTIHAYSFLPADGVEQLINLRARVATRLQAARDVVGSDEDFFGEGSEEAAALRDLYNEKSGILDDQDDGEVDLASYAYQIWKNAVERDPRLEELIPALQPVTFGTRGHCPTPDAPGGALVYLRSPQGNDTLMWLDEHGNSVTESQLTILKAAACAPGTPALPRLEQHHDLVRRAARQVVEEEGDGGVGALGGPSSLRRKLYERLSHIRDVNRGSPLFDRPELGRVLDDLLAAPLQEATSLTLRTQLKLNVSDATLAELVVNLRNEGRLTVALARGSRKDPSILCSMGLKA